ncbi:YadA-like family protein, partial [Psychrobacter celer]|uniref:YadA-like family protein n=1 Tax=Psychrobacter celer TaxID=306572 RepID=UPI003FD13D14
VSANGTAGENVAPGAKVDFSNTDGNIVIAQTGTDLEFDLNKDLKVDSITTGNSKTDDSGLSIDDGTGNLTTVTNDGLTIAGGPSVTQSGIDAASNKIVNVAAGTEDDDAVNFGQLSQVSGNVNKGLNFTGDDTTTIINRQLGDTLNIRGGATGALTNGNIGVVANGNQLEVKMAENIDLGSDGSVTTGDTVVNNDGLTIAGGPSVTKDGIDAGGSQITNVGSALGGKDLADITGDGLSHAVNVGDLKDTVGNINKDIAASKTEVTEGKNITVTETTGADGQTRYEVATKDDLVAHSVTAGDEAGGTKLDKDGVTITGGPNEDVVLGSDGLDNGGNKITNVADGSIAAGSTDAINGGQLHNLGSDVAGIIGGDATYDANGNLTANNIGGTGKGNISDAIASINQGNAQANEDIQVNADNIQANTDRLDTGLSFGADTGDNINKPIGDSSALKFEGGNNITTSATGDSIKFDLNGNISVDSVTADSVTTGNTTVSNNGITIKEGPSMTTDGINAGDKTITGVADGIEVNDAVNLGQLNALDGKLSNSVNELGYKINEVEDDANAGISAAMAMSSLPQAYIPGKSMVGGGIATYNGQSAVAIGVSKVSDNGRWVIKVNGTADTQGNAGGAVGAGFHF